MTIKSKQLCMGCRENFYNGNNPHDIKECWNYAGAKVVTRYRIGWWTPMTSADNFDKVQVLSCRCDPGRYAYLEDLPQHLRASTRKGQVRRTA